jgi:predicted phage tail protein
MWNASAGATSYRVAASGPGISVNVPVGNTTRVDGNGLAAGVYNVSVFARGAAGENPVPATTSFTIGTSGNLPPAPTGISNSIAGRNVTVTWNVAPGATSYHLTALLNGVLVFNQNVGGTTRVDAVNVPPGHYTIEVFSVNTAGRSIVPATTSFAIDGGHPPTPTGITHSILERHVAISWNAAPGATSYHVTALLNGAVIFSQNLGGSTRLAAQSVPPGHYTVQVFSVNAWGQSVAPAITTFIIQ